MNEALNSADEMQKKISRVLERLVYSGCLQSDAQRKVIVFFTLPEAASHFEVNYCLNLKLFY